MNCKSCQATQLILDLLIEALIHHEKCPNCYGIINGETTVSLNHAVTKIREVVKKKINEDKD